MSWPQKCAGEFGVCGVWRVCRVCGGGGERGDAARSKAEGSGTVCEGPTQPEQCLRAGGSVKAVGAQQPTRPPSPPTPIPPPYKGEHVPRGRAGSMQTVFPTTHLVSRSPAPLPPS